MRVIDILNSPMAMYPPKFEEIGDIYISHVRGPKIDIAGIEAQIGRPLANEHQPPDIRDGVAIIEMHGVMGRRMNLFSKISGGASTQMVQRDLQEAINSSRTHAVILAIDSPGGTVDGTQELANAVFAARGKKPVVALVEQAMSAAYWVASAAEEIYISSETAMTGSIGVVTRHIDVSRAEDKVGIKTTEVFSGKYKRVASEFAPLTDEGKAHLQALTDDIYAVFVNDVARNRGVSAEQALERMAEGRVFVGRKAIDAGLADGVSTIDALVQDLVAGRKPARRK
jgi:signal peptide peptidase SppA